MRAATARLVAAHTGIPWARAWGGGEVASADGRRFVVPGRTVHAAPPKYFGIGRGVTFYNLVSDQCTGLHGITVPGTLRDSLVLLAGALEQHTALQPTQIMPDTGASSDVVFGLFRLRGDRFSPRRADIGGPRGWRIDARADDGPRNRVARHSVNLDRITPPGGRYVADGRRADTRARTGHRYHAHAAGGGSATAPGAGVRGVRTDRQDTPHGDVPRR